MKYFDKHGTEIQAGMMIRHDDGSIDKVYATMDFFGNMDLSVNASNDDLSLIHISEPTRH